MHQPHKTSLTNIVHPDIGNHLSTIPIMKVSSSLLTPIICLTLVATSFAQDDVLDKLSALASKVQVDSVGGAEVVDLEQGIFRYSNSVHIKYEGTEILSDFAEFNRSTGDIKANGNVSIYREGILYSGESAIYNIDSNKIVSDNLKSSVVAQNKELYFQTESLNTQIGENDGSDVIDTSGTLLTTHDYQTPNWHILADELDIYPDDRVVFKDVTFYAKGIPVMWLPYLAQPLDEELGYTFAPGWDSSWGGYLLNQYGTLLGEEKKTLATIHFDLRSERGLAGGIDFKSAKYRENPSLTGLKLYYAYDLSPATSRTSDNDRPGNQIPETNRYRINLQHRIYVSGHDESIAIEDAGTKGAYQKRIFTPRDDSFYLNFDLNILSDGYFYEDFYPGEFRIDPQPDNTVELIKRFNYSEASLLGRFNLNEFFQTDTRLPELALDTVRMPVFGGRVNYEGTSSFGILEEIPAEGIGARSTDLLNSIGYNRLDTYHQFSRAFQLFNFLSVVPRAGVRFTNYSSPSGDTVGFDRLLGHVGLDTSFKVSRDYDSVQSRALGLDGIRHVIQPYLRYSYIEGDDIPVGFRGIDDYVASTRPRPLDPTQFTAIDSLAGWNIARLGVFNRLITKRNTGSLEWLSFNTYFDTFIEDPEFDRDFSNLYQDIAWRPLPWLRLNLDSQFPVFGGDASFTEINSRVTYMPTPSIEISLGHRFLNDHPFLQNSNQVTIDYFQRIRENWGFSVRHRWELDDSTLETQQYSIHRDMTSWTASLGGIVRDNRGVNDYGVLFTLTLKEFPQFNIPISLDPQGAAN